MSAAITVIIVLLGMIPCLWLALFVLSWRDARRNPNISSGNGRDSHQEFATSHARKPAQRKLQSWLIFGLLAGLHLMLAFLVWPGLLGNWAGSRKRL
jgi:hypothetical protein